MKRRILIGSHGGPNFARRTAKVDCAHINLGELHFYFIHKINSFSLLSRNLSFLKDKFKLIKRPQKRRENDKATIC